VGGVVVWRVWGCACVVVWGCGSVVVVVVEGVGGAGLWGVWWCGGPGGAVGGVRCGGCGGCGGVGVWWVVGGFPLRSNIPRSALCATLDTYNFKLSSSSILMIRTVQSAWF
jgi:hypothetical protein